MGVLDGMLGTSADVPGVSLKRVLVSLYNKKMGGKGDYGTEKEVKIKDMDRNGRKHSGRRKIHERIIYQSETMLVSSCRISIFSTESAVGLKKWL